MPKKPRQAPEPSMEERMKTKREELVVARTKMEQELNGIGNQIYIIDILLNPPPAPEPETKPEDAPEAAQEDTGASQDGVDMPKGTI